MKKRHLILGLTALAIGISSCTEEGCTDATATNYNADATEDDGSCEYATDNTDNESTVVVSSNITSGSHVTWTADKVYQLGGRIAVESGATLTIEPGTVIKGEAGTGANATALLIARGGKLMAEGTAALPIIFTSVADEITPEQVATGDFKSPNLDATANGLWGGLIVLGNAHISAGSGETTQIEGIPSSDENGKYGGTQDDDNSGVLKYISVRHGGSNIGAGNEINGISFGGVGSGTVVENIEVVGNQDDGIEWYGGTVNGKNLLVWNCGDDGLDTDQAWAGTVDEFMIVTVAGHSFELDGPEGTYDNDGHKFMNGTVIASDAAYAAATEDTRMCKDLINLDANSDVEFDNVLIKNIQDGQVVDTDGTVADDSEESLGRVAFANVMLDVPADSLSNHIKGGVDAPEGIAAGSTGGATASNFSWTWASQAGAL